jgi:hypothetical protein
MRLKMLRRLLMLAVIPLEMEHYGQKPLRPANVRIEKSGESE